MPQDGGGDAPRQQSPLSDKLKDLLKFRQAFTQFVNEPRFGHLLKEKPKRWNWVALG